MSHDPPGGSETALTGALGAGSIVFMVLAAAAPLSVIAGTFPLIIMQSQSYALPAYFVAVTLILIVFSVGYTRMSRYVHNAGAFYSYVQTGLGRAPGLGAATLALASYVVLLIGINCVLGVFLGQLVATVTGAVVPWWAWSLFTLLTIGVLGYRNIEVSSRVLAVLLGVESLIVVALDIAIIARGGADGLSLAPFSVSVITMGAPGLGLMFAFFSYFGFEATAVFRAEAKNPDRTIPVATYLAVIVIGVFYSISAWAVVMGVGAENLLTVTAKDPVALVIELGRVYLGPIAADLIQVLVVTSVYAAVLSFHNVITRYLYTLARKGVLPSRLGAISPKHRVPSTASLTLSAIALLATGAIVATSVDPVYEAYPVLTGIATLGIVLLMTITTVSVLAYFHSAPARGSLWQRVVAPVAALVGLLFVLVLVVWNYPLLVGSVPAALGSGLLVALAFCSGLLVAARLKHRRPEAYRDLVDQAQTTIIQ